MEITAKTVVFVIGAPGSGKGTLCRRLSDEYAFYHVSVGDTLRRLVSDSRMDRVTTSRVQRGELVSTEMLIDVLQDSVKDSVCSSYDLILIDGMPRQLDQAMPVENKIGSPALVLFFNCREEVAKNRFLTRKLPGRERDDAAIFQKRYDEFATENSKILKMYQERGLLIEVDTNDETEISYKALVDRLSNTCLASYFANKREDILPFSMFPKAVSRAFRLEVERKFCGFAVADLAPHVGNPPFQTIQSQGQRVFHDTYFDRAGRLAAAGVWVRLRNGKWEAKVRKGGDFQNSRFEELSDPHKIGKQVQAITGQGCNERESFGLDRIANMSTTRTTWLADERFTIVLDRMDFGHEVGEVELQSEVHLAYTGQALEDHKQRAMQQMDQEIVAFMQHYRWAFAAGVPIGKLTAYFEREAAGGL
ncbi:hypothetical protein AA0117_g12934 [Alternaria alternata]|uniref:Thiamine-triphosphatase n=1 Tax=Alternaria alternata TaxID=5599 RepID=A0A4Q4MXJ4_ALTAL|nr:hypothetical protein AA0117_g12934 [Alternaria alternata]